MQITVLNGTYVADESTVTSLQPRMGAVLLVLLVEGTAGPVPAERLLTLAWETPPADRRPLHQTMHRLRGILGRDRIVSDRRTDTYQFVPRPGDTVDLWSWRELVDICARRSHSDPHSAVLLWDRALARWPLTGLRGLPTNPHMTAFISTLLAERLRATEQQAEVKLQLGMHDQVVMQLTPLVEQHWHREHLRGLLMTGLYRQARGADALDLYGHYRRRLYTETGTEPGRAIQNIAQRIASGDMALLEVNPPPLPAGDQAVAASGAPPASVSIARMCVAILDNNSTASYSTAHDRAACLTFNAWVTGLMELEKENMAFGNRFARHVAIQHGIARYLELGALPPAWYSLHRAAQLANPAARVVYANYDPALVNHSRQQLTDVDGVDFVHASLLQPRALLEDPTISDLLQLSKPLEEREPVAIIDRHELNSISPAHDLKAMYAMLTDQIAPGSLFALCGPTPEGMAPQVGGHLTEVFAGNTAAERVVHQRTAQQMVSLVPDGLDLVPPSPADASQFWPEPGPAGQPDVWRQNGLVAIKQ